MNFKEFFKPTKGKIITTIIIFAIVSFIPIWPYLLCGSWECWPGIGPFLLSILSLKNSEFYDLYHLKPLLTTLVIVITVSYLTSCIIFIKKSLK